MKFPYLVVHNHVEYPPFTEVPIGEKTSEKAEVEQEIEEKAEVVESNYTKTEINRMSLADLRKVASENNVEDADTKSGAELKKNLIAILGLQEF